MDRIQLCVAAFNVDCIIIIPCTHDVSTCVTGGGGRGTKEAEPRREPALKTKDECDHPAHDGTH